jgi:hypothetical protein
MAAEASKAAGIPRYVFISATVPKIPGIEFLLSGYIDGKARAEEAVKRLYPESGVSLRPSIVYGNR